MFADCLINLKIASQKAKTSKYGKIAEEIEKLYTSAVNSLNELDNKISPSFKLCTQDFESESYISFNADDIKNINLAFSMLNCFLNSCNKIEEIAGILTNI